MPATLDLSAVRRFTERLSEQARQCDNGEGMICNTLEESINYYVHLCGELRVFVKQWAQAVFTGEAPFDKEVEDLLKGEVQLLLRRCKDVAACGRAMDGVCFVLDGLNQLHFHIADFDYLLSNWVSPRLAVSPAPRVKLTKATVQKVAERLGGLPALPADWRPDDPQQRAFFERQQQAKS